MSQLVFLGLLDCAGNSGCNEADPGVDCLEEQCGGEFSACTGSQGCLGLIGCMEDCPEGKVGSSLRQELMGSGQENISSREDAYRILQEVGQYLEAIEPHSPTPYLLRRAVAWGGMSFAQLLDELVRDPSDVRIIYEFLGLPPSKEIEQ